MFKVFWSEVKNEIANQPATKGNMNDWLWCLLVSAYYFINNYDFSVHNSVNLRVFSDHNQIVYERKIFTKASVMQNLAKYFNTQ